MSKTRRSIPFWRLAGRNTLRNTRRTLLTASAIMVAVMALTYAPAHIEGLMGNMVDTYARTESGHVRIRKAGYTARERARPMHLFVPQLSEVLPTIRAHPDVEAALPRIRSLVLVDKANANRNGLLMGVDLAGEEGYLNPSAVLNAGRLPRPGHAEVMVGKDFGEKLDVSLGDTLTLLGQTAYRSLGGLRMTVTGFAVTGLAYLDNVLLMASLDQVQLLTDLPDATIEILVFAKDPEQADALAHTLHETLNAQVSGGIEAVSWTEQGPLINMITTYRPVLGVILSILLLMASLIIINTVLMTVMERTQELGMLASLGMRRSDIVVLILIEGLVIGLIGALVGGALGTSIALWLEHAGIDVTAAMRGVEFPIQGVVYPDWKVVYTLWSAGLGMLTAVLATLYPAWRAVRKTPAEALRG